MNRIAIYGAEASGKTRNAEALMKHFGCTALAEGWDGRTPLADGTLALTNNSIMDVFQVDGVHCIERALEKN